MGRRRLRHCRNGTRQRERKLHPQDVLGAGCRGELRPHRDDRRPGRVGRADHVAGDRDSRRAPAERTCAHVGAQRSRASIWTPPATAGASGSFVSANETSDLFCGGQTFLPDGRILVAGGHSGTNSLGIRNSATFNYTTNTFTAGPLMQNGRWYPTNTTLANGEVVTMSGGDTVQQRNLIPEVYQANGTWRVLSTASLYLPYYPMNFVTPTGTVFAAGPAKTTYFLDPTGTGHWTAGPSSAFGSRDYGSAVMYETGKIFMVGGGDPPTATAEVIDLNGGSGAWRSVASMAVARRQSNATILADGKVLVTGGTNASGFNSRSLEFGGARGGAVGSVNRALDDARAHDALSRLSLHRAAAAGCSRAVRWQRSACRRRSHG